MDSLSGTWIPNAIYGLISIQRQIFAAQGFCPAVLSFFRGVCRIGRFWVIFAVNLLNKNKKSVPGRICVYVCSTQPRALCLYSFKDIN